METTYVVQYRASGGYTARPAHFEDLADARAYIARELRMYRRLGIKVETTVSGRQWVTTKYGGHYGWITLRRVGGSEEL